ncbi:UDP-glucose 6-dehydrogenase [Nitrobacteraceae bacterium AZCC 2146]
MPLRIVEAVPDVNDNRKRAMARKVSNAPGGNLRGKTVAVLGLTFKSDTDDMREAPSIPLVTGLLDMGAKVRAFDPIGDRPRPWRHTNEDVFQPSSQLSERSFEDSER